MAALDWLNAAIPSATPHVGGPGVGCMCNDFRTLGCDGPRSAAIISPVRNDETGLSKRERGFIETAVASRRREFATGRRMAKWCLDRIGHPRGCISRHADRSPVWPAGLVGSISHCRHLAAAVASSEWLGVGVDVECLNHPALAGIPGLFTAAEQQIVRQPYGPAILFSAKEAVYKAVYPQTRTQADFVDVEIDLHLTDRRFAVRYVGPPGKNEIMEQVRGVVTICNDHVLTLAVIDPPAQDSSLKDQARVRPLSCNA